VSICAIVRSRRSFYAPSAMTHDMTRSASHRWTEIVSLLAIAATAIVIYGWIVAGGVGIITSSDSADYLFFADFYRGQFYTDVRPQDLAFYWATRFPPLFPLVLAAFGGGTHDLQYTQGIACGITLGMFAILWWWVRRETGSAFAAATILLLVVLSPGLFMLNLNPMSESLAMGMTWLAFLFAQRAPERPERFLLVALLGGLSALARSINIALVLAIPIWLLLQRATPRRWLACTATALAPFLLWLVYRRMLPRAAAYTDGIDLAFVVNELGGWPDLLWVHPWRLVTAFAKNFDTRPDAWSIALASILLIAAAVGWWRRARARRLDAAFLLVYVGVILVWPYPREAMRFLTFVMPLMLFHAWVGIDWAIARSRSSRPAPQLASAGLAMLVLLASAGTIAHFFHLATHIVDPELRGEQREQTYFFASDRTTAEAAARGLATLRIAAREATRLVPEGECVYAVMPYLLERHAALPVMTYPHGLDPTIPIEHQLSKCRFLFVMGVPGAWDFQVPFYPMEHVHGTTHVVFSAEVSKGSSVAALLTWNDDVEERRRAYLQSASKTGE
jgi:hypothetical protein